MSHLVSISIRVVCPLLIMFGCLAQSKRPPAPSIAASEDKLRSFLQKYVIASGLPNDTATAYFDAFIDLNRDGQKEAIVYLVGRWWCGSGGCPTLVLTPTASSYRIVTNILITRPPI